MVTAIIGLVINFLAVGSLLLNSRDTLSYVIQSIASLWQYFLSLTATKKLLLSTKSFVAKMKKSVRPWCLKKPSLSQCCSWLRLQETVRPEELFPNMWLCKGQQVPPMHVLPFLLINLDLQHIFPSPGSVSVHWEVIGPLKCESHGSKDISLVKKKQVVAAAW